MMNRFEEGATGPRKTAPSDQSVVGLSRSRFEEEPPSCFTSEGEYIGTTIELLLRVRVWISRRGKACLKSWTGAGVEAAIVERR
jgi:hypothetical protein